MYELTGAGWLAALTPSENKKLSKYRSYCTNALNDQHEFKQRKLEE